MIQFRDERLKKVKSATVARDLGLLSAVFKYARQETKNYDQLPIGRHSQAEAVTE